MVFIPWRKRVGLGQYGLRQAGKATLKFLQQERNSPIGIDTLLKQQ
jgi:hypothetical protein